MRLHVILAAIALNTPAFAQESDPTDCQFTGSWGDIEGRSSTIMLVKQNQENFDDGDSVIVAFFNDDWSIGAGEDLGQIKIENENGGWFANAATAMNHGFLIWSEYDHIENVFGGVPDSMHITRKGKVVDQLRISGLFSDWIKFKSCRNKKVVIQKEIERKAALAKEVPKDPFEN
jgi:hypothetical protein